jgi:hypothetical protein
MFREMPGLEITSRLPKRDNTNTNWVSAGVCGAQLGSALGHLCFFYYLMMFL